MRHAVPVHSHGLAHQSLCRQAEGEAAGLAGKPIFNMYRDVACLLHLKSNLRRDLRSSRPGVAIYESGSNHEDDIGTKNQDVERVELFVIRAALGAISVIQKMLNILAFPVLLCVEGKLIYLGLFLAMYEILYLVNGGIVISLVERYFLQVGFAFLRYLAISCQIVGWLLYLIILGSEGQFELLWAIQILFGFSSLLQLQLLSGEATSEHTDVESCGGVASADQERVVSDLGLMHHSTVLGPCIGILASIGVRFEEGSGVSRSIVRGLIPIGVFGVLMAFTSLLLAVYSSLCFTSSSNNSGSAEWATTERDRAIITAVDMDSSPRQYTAQRMDRALLYTAAFLFLFVFEGSLWTIFAYNYSSSDATVSFITVYTPFLIGAAVAYASQLECWCWRSQSFVSAVSRYRCVAPARGYISSQLGAAVLLVTCVLQIITATVFSSPTLLSRGILRPTVYAAFFLLGMSGALYFPSLQAKILNLRSTGGSSDDIFAVSSSSPQQEIRRMAALKTNLWTINMVCAAGRCAGLLFAGTIVGYQSSRHQPTCRLDPVSDPSLLYLLASTDGAISLSLVVLMAALICTRLPVSPPSAGASYVSTAGVGGEVSAAMLLYHRDPDGVDIFQSQPPPHSPRIPIPSQVQERV